MPFKKGNNANPKGRPSGKAEPMSRFNHYGAMSPDEIKKLDANKLTAWDCVLVNWLKRSMTDQKAAMDYASYYLGKPKESHEHEHKGTVKIEIVNPFRPKE